MGIFLFVLGLGDAQGAVGEEGILGGEIEIVRAERSTPAVHLAVRELAHFLGRVIGVRPKVVADPTPGRNHLFVGRNPHSEAAGVTSDGLAPEGFRMRSVGRDLHIVGDDGPGNPERVKRTEPTRCGTLYGVYEFLERYAGVFFAWHDELGTIVPSRKEIHVPWPVDIVQAPDWQSRTIINTPPGSTGRIFGRRLRLGGSVETDYTHNWFRIVPPERYAAAHPEYFALIRGERRTSHYLTHHGGQVCTTNPEVIELFARAAIEAFRKNPRDEVFPISPNDGKGFCECDPCRALDSTTEGATPS